MKRKKPITERPSLDENRDIKEMHANSHLQSDVETETTGQTLLTC